MKKTIQFFSLLCALLMLFASCAGNNVIAPTQTPTQTPATETPATETPVEPLMLDENDLMRGVTPNHPATTNQSEQFLSAASKFDTLLFEKIAAGAKGENVIISPLSVMLALAMTANGASGQTKTELETLLGGLPMAQLNEALYIYMKSLPSTDGGKFNYADAIFIDDDQDFIVNPAFLQTNADYFGAGAFKMPCGQQALDAINKWTSDRTDGMIEKILDTLPDDAKMVLINALCFDANWAFPYYDRSVKDEKFYALDGSVQNVKMMHSSEYIYLDDEKSGATGFVKSYENGRYAFAALLPNEGVDLYDYIATLKDGRLSEVLKNRSYATVVAGLPQFKSDFGTELQDLLAALGAPSAFNPFAADFSGISQSVPLYIDRVVHKGYIEVTKSGTKAAAVTAVVPRAGAAEPTNLHTVMLDRPFIYTVFDTKTNLPIFIGVQTSIS